MQQVYIKEKSWVAKIGANLLGVRNVALTIGNTIYLHNATKQELLQNKIWLCHELVHVQQYQQFGVVKFLFVYAKEWLVRGYYQNKFEVEARAKENDFTLLTKFKVS